VASVVSVNLADRVERVSYTRVPTGIGKVAADGPVQVREPGRKRGGLGSGLVGDVIGDERHHGGTDQAVYTYAREGLDEWASELGRPLRHGMFGENLTTAGLDVDGALVGERWRVGSSLVLQVTGPRIPCATFRGWMGERRWVKRFVDAGRPGAYLRVVTGGPVSAGDRIEVVHRPHQGVTVSLAFRALIREPVLLPELAAAGDDLTDELQRMVGSGGTFRLDS
jgi:MOSC domain-containing protein YiiM